MIEYALYKAVLCSFYATLDADRDQSKTLETIALANTFVSRKNIFTKYTSEVENILTSCYQKVVESEIGIFNFYINQGNVLSAQQRLDHLNKEWLAKLPTCAHQLNDLQARLDNQQALITAKTAPKKSSESSTTVAQAPSSFSNRF
jgi:outer membrane protein assembly factor BamD (BamD/ComL family)